MEDRLLEKIKEDEQKKAEEAQKSVRDMDLKKRFGDFDLKK